MGIDALHAPLAPSRASRWGPGGCMGSAKMEARYPEDTESEEARQGTAAHWYATETLQGRPPTIGTLAPNGYPIDVEMVECAESLLRDVRDTLAACGPGATILIETRVTMRHAVHPDNWGTPDIVIIDWANKRIHVWDYKYGHRYVDVFRSMQLLNYACGVFETHNIDEFDDWGITLTVAQPRNYAPEGPMREWHLTGRELRPFRESLRVAAIGASQPNPPLQTGEHCRDCLAAHACPALQRAAMLAVDYSHRQQSIDMPADAVGLELLILTAAGKRLKARLDALDAHAAGLIRKGQDVPHWTFGRSQPHAKWTHGYEEVVAMGRLFGHDLAAPPKPLTPAQAKKLIDPAVIEQYSERPLGSLVLVPMDDVKASRAFGGP